MRTGIKQIASENALALAQRRAGTEGMKANETGITLLKNHGLSQGTAQRFLASEGDVRLEAIDVLARGLRVEPWQLLVPGLDPTALPELHPSTSVFSPDLMARLRALPAHEVARLENGLRGQLDMELLPRDASFQKTTGAKTPAQKSSPGASAPGDRRQPPHPGTKAA